jgi:hypothetical protein
VNPIEINSLSQEKKFGVHGECYYCSLLRKDGGIQRGQLMLEARLNIVADYAPSIFYLDVVRDDNQLSADDRLTLNDQFFSQFNALEIINVSNLVIDRFQLSSSHAHCLTRLFNTTQPFEINRQSFTQITNELFIIEIT